MSDLGPEVVNYVSHASQTRLQNLLEKVSEVAQQRNINFKVCTVLCIFASLACVPMVWYFMVNECMC